MKHVVATACLFGVLAATAWAYTLPDDEAEPTDSLQTILGDPANEAIILGQLLRDVAADLMQEKELGAEAEEYSFRDFWTKFKASMKKAGSKIKSAFKAVGKQLKEPVKAVAKVAAKVAIEKAQEVLKKKAVTLVAKIFEKAAASYAVEDNVNGTNFMKYMCARMDQVGERLIHQGKTLKALQ